MIIKFKLSMPNSPSWDGKWSCRDKNYVLLKTIRCKEQADKILQGGPYFHSWNDGWTAMIDVSQVDSRSASNLRRKSDGFCGYDWMVSNIILHGTTENQSR